MRIEVSGQRSHLQRWVLIWLHPGVAEQDLARPAKSGSVRREIIRNGDPLIIPLGFLLTSLCISAVRGEGLSWTQGVRGRGEGRPGREPGGAGGDWERSPGEGDSKDWATVITASEKALAKERRGAAGAEGRGEVEEHRGNGGGVRAPWGQLGEEDGGELGMKELGGD